LTNLKLCLDAGDLNSYDGSSQVWKDLSGGGYDFNRGSGSGSDSADPTYNGTAGRQSSGEYFSFDGGDYFTLAQANPAWVNNLHKDNAKLSIAAWVYSSNIATGTSEGIFGTSSFSGTTFGVAFAVGQAVDGDIGFAMQDGNSGAGDSVGTTSAKIVAGGFTFIAMSLDEATASIVLQINATQETKTYSYASPSSSAASFTAQVGAIGNGNSALKSGFRIACLAAWEGVTLSSGQMTSIYSSTRGKFGV
jgi:hypothetical protein